MDGDDKDHKTGAELLYSLRWEPDVLLGSAPVPPLTFPWQR